MDYLITLPETSVFAPGHPGKGETWKPPFVRGFAVSLGEGSIFSMIGCNQVVHLGSHTGRHDGLQLIQPLPFP